MELQVAHREIVIKAKRGLIDGTFTREGVVEGRKMSASRMISDRFEGDAIRAETRISSDEGGDRGNFGFFLGLGWESLME